MEYDVIVVGAGPAGSAAAKMLADRGFKTLIIDRASFPRSKICGDGLTPGATSLLQKLDVFSFLQTEAAYPINAIRFVTPKWQSLRVPFKSKYGDAGFLIIKRQNLDFALLKSAQHSGAQFLQAEVVGLQKADHYVQGVHIRSGSRRQTIKARIVIGADGVSSVVARSLHVPKIPATHRFLAIRGYVKGFRTFEHMVEFIWTSELKPGYFWIFPTSQTEANIGLGLPADLYQKNGIKLKEHFFKLLRQPFFEDRLSQKMEISELKSWPIPLAGLFNMQRAFDGALLVGDAGYWVDPLSGEGIHNALKTGMIAAEVVTEALQANNVSRTFLKQYEKRAWQALGPTIKRSLLFVRGMRHVPWLLELYFFLARHSQPAFRRFFSHLSQDFDFDLEGK